MSGGKNGRQVRKRRKDGWTLCKRTIFLDHLRATSNVRASARAVGMSEGSAHKLRERDPEFAAGWEAALREAEVRLTGKLIVFAETRGKRSPSARTARPPRRRWKISIPTSR